LLANYCINAITKEMVLDNFIGSGIIAIAAKE
jgi:methylase of polypeptide subunit release factors